MALWWLLPAGALEPVGLWWLLPAGVARVGLVGVPFACGVGRTFGGFGGFEAWQTAA